MSDGRCTRSSTFAEVIVNNLAHHEGGHTFILEDGREQEVPWSELSLRALRQGQELLRTGLRRGDHLALMLPDGMDFVPAFLGAVSVGVIPVPMFPPQSFGRFEAYLEGASNILRSSGARALCLPQGFVDLLRPLLERSPELRPLVVEELAENSAHCEPARPPSDLRPEDVMFLQFTSGSTSAPKGVRVTHASAMANCQGIIEALRLQPQDKGVSWLPMFHDMGLVGFVLGSLLVRCPVVFIPTLRFAMEPGLWMRTVSRHRASVTFAPNFGLAVATRQASEAELAQLDLSSLRVLGCGAEPNHPATLRAFEAHFRRAGLRPGTLVTCYGMAEATLAMSFSAMGAALDTDVILPEPYHSRGEAKSASPDEAPGATRMEVVSCGCPLPGHRFVVVDEAGHPLPERHVGEVVFQGPSVTAGYHGDPLSTQRVFTEQGVYTGDCGYLAGGTLYVTGRKKDLLIINGRNYDPQTVEWAAAEVPGLRKGNVVAFTRPGPVTEELVIVAEARGGHASELSGLVLRHVQTALSLPVADVLLLEPGTLSKTSSGKLQRSRTRQRYLSGALNEGRLPLHG